MLAVVSESESRPAGVKRHPGRARRAGGLPLLLLLLLLLGALPLLNADSQQAGSPDAVPVRAAGGAASAAARGSTFSPARPCLLRWQHAGASGAFGAFNLHCNLCCMLCSAWPCRFPSRH